MKKVKSTLEHVEISIAGQSYHADADGIFTVPDANAAELVHLGFEVVGSVADVVAEDVVANQTTQSEIEEALQQLAAREATLETGQAAQRLSRAALEEARSALEADRAALEEALEEAQATGKKRK